MRKKREFPFKCVVKNDDLVCEQFKLMCTVMLVPIWPFAVPVYYYDGPNRPILAVVPETGLRIEMTYPEPGGRL